MKAKILLALVVTAVFLPMDLKSQTPATVVVPAQVASPTASSAAESPLKFLQEMKAANEVTLKSQAAQLAALDDLQKAADEIKIYSKRG